MLQERAWQEMRKVLGHLGRGIITDQEAAYMFLCLVDTDQVGTWLQAVPAGVRAAVPAQLRRFV